MSYSKEIIELPVSTIKIPDNRYQRLKPLIVEQLKASIEEVGLKNPLTVTRGTNQLVSGLHRLHAYRLLGRDTIPVIYTETDEFRNDIEQIDENLVRQPVNFIDRAQQVMHKLKLLIKVDHNVKSIHSEEMMAYLEDPFAFQPIIDNLRIDLKDFVDYRKVVLHVDEAVIQYLKDYEEKNKTQILKTTYLTLADLPKEWQYRYVNALEEDKNLAPNSTANDIYQEFKSHEREQKLLAAQQAELERKRKEAEERERQLEAEKEALYKKQEEERKKREAEAEKKRLELIEQMKKAEAEEERKALIRKQEELERQERQRKLEAERKEKLERERLEKQRQEERRRREEEEEKRRKEEEERKKVEAYKKLHNTLPPKLTNTKASQNIIDLSQQAEPKTKHRVIHYQDSFTKSSLVSKGYTPVWIHSLDYYELVKQKGLDLIQFHVKEFEKAMFVCTNKLDIVKVAELIERYEN